MPYQGRAIGSDVPFPAELTYGEDNYDSQPQGSVKVYVDNRNLLGNVGMVIGRAKITSEGTSVWDNIVLTYDGSSCLATCQNLTSVHFMGLKSQKTLAVYKTDEDEDYTINAIYLEYDVSE